MGCSKKRNILLEYVILMLVAGVPALADPYTVELSVQESAGVSREREPISGGVPLPRGMFKQDQAFALKKEDGSVLPCQISPLVVEPDGTLTWILLDFQDAIKAGTTNRYQLQAIRSAEKCESSLVFKDGPEEIRVDTGRISFAISRKKPFALFDRVLRGKSQVAAGGVVSYTQLQGRKGWDDRSEWQPKKLVAGVPASASVIYAGPLRITIAVKGRFVDDPCAAAYKAWITAWAGQSRVHVKYKLCNSNPDGYTVIPVKQSSLKLVLTAPGGGVMVGADNPILMSERKGAWLHQGLHLHHTYQDIGGAARAGQGDKNFWTCNAPSQRPSGWMSVRGVFVWDRLFSANPARRLSVHGDILELQGIAERFTGPMDGKFKEKRRVGEPWKSGGFWLYDCSHHTSEYLFEFRSPGDPTTLDDLAKASRNRLWVLASGDHYSQCQALGSGHFATLAQEAACYRKWGWSFKENQVPDRKEGAPHAFVAREDNHYESEADSVQGLLLMYLRTGQRGWFDLGEAWARYHMDLQTWRTDGWAWKDGGIWFPSGGPQGNMPVRKQWNFKWGADWGDRKGSADCADLWAHARSKSCYCHFYGSGLVDYYCLTGDVDALEAAIDNVEQKDNEFRGFRKFRPGASAVASIRGFGRGFEVMMRVLMADPGNKSIRSLCDLCARTLWQSPLMDERGFHCSKIGGGWSGMPVKHLSPAIRKWMKDNGITFTAEGSTVASLSKNGKTWPVRCMGGTWQHVYIQNGAELYARYTGDENMHDFTIAFAQMSAKYMLSPKCHQTWYYTYFDVPDLGMVFDPWRFDHADTQDGEGCVHSGWYTRFYPDACARGYSLTGERQLLNRARDFWHYGSRRSYRAKHLKGGKNEVNMFIQHHPPKDDTVLSASRLLYEGSWGRKDDAPPASVGDLKVMLSGDGSAVVTFTAPEDRGGGRVARYQVKVDLLPIVAYKEWDAARDRGTRRNWWRAVNCAGEPRPGKAGSRERFTLRGIPDSSTLYFAVRSFDDSNNRSGMSNVVKGNAP